MACVWEACVYVRLFVSGWGNPASRQKEAYAINIRIVFHLLQQNVDRERSTALI